MALRARTSTADHRHGWGGTGARGRGAKALSGFLADAVRRGDVPGVVVMVVSPDRTQYHEAFGIMDVAQGVDMRRTTAGC